MNTKKITEERPTFLTVLCILSFVGLGLKILNSFSGMIFGLFTSRFEPIIRENISQNIHYSDIPVGIRSIIIDSLDIAYKAMERATPMSLVTLVLAVAALFGVIMMWKLRKEGFYLYTGSKIFILMVPLLFLGLNFITLVGVCCASFFAILFIILYAVNMKHMK
jgi:hypothetical protein